MKPILNKGPKFNKYVTRGMAYDEIKDNGLSYIDDFLSSILKKHHSVRYLGLKELSITDEVNSNIGVNLKSKKDYDVTVTFERKYQILLEYKGVPLPGGLIYIPFTTKKGITYSSGARYHIIPVVSDSVLSVSLSFVFIRLLRDKLFIKTDIYKYVKNGKTITMSINHSEHIYKNIKVPGKIGNVLNPIDTYILTNTNFKTLFANINVLLHYGVLEDVNWPIEQYDVYSSTGTPPINRITDGYTSSRLIIGIEKSVELTNLQKNIITSLFYIFDVFPKMGKDFVNLVNNNDTVSEKLLWKHIIARFIFRDTVEVVNAIEAVDLHLLGLDNYIDPIINKKLLEVGINVDSFYSLLGYVSEKGTELKLTHQKVKDDIYTKYIDILYYIFYPLIVNANNFLTELNSLERKGTMTIDTVNNAVSNNFTPRSLFNGYKTNDMSLAVMPCSSTIDWAGDISNKMDLQERGKGVIRKTSSYEKLPSNKKVLRAGDIFTGSILHTPKDWPTPMANMNVFATIDEDTRRIAPDGSQREIMELLNLLLTGVITTHSEKYNVNENDEIYED